MHSDIPDFPLRWLYLDLNSYFASVEQQINPHLRGRPVAVVPVMTDSTCAIAASYEAKKFGIRTGTPIYEAKKLCPEIICVLGNHEIYTDYHHRILAEVENHIPIDDIASIDEVACRLMDNENSIEKTLEIARKIKKGITQNIGECLRSSIGIAPNKYLAKLGTELEKPDGLVVLQSSDLPDRICGLSLNNLPGIGRNMEKRLHNTGISQVRQLYELSPKQMRQIWHSLWGEKMWYYLRGYEIPDVETVRKSVGHSHVMAPELRDPAQAVHVARRLTIKAASRLRRLEFFANRMQLSARIENGPRVVAEISFNHSSDNFTLLKALEIMWAEVTNASKKSRLKKVSITLTGLKREDEIQPDLFENTGLEKQRRLNQLSSAMDKINHRFGRDSILVGITPEQGKGFSGTKIAFTRIPDIEEFLE